MATNRPQGDLVGWRINTNHFGFGKPLKFLPWIKKNLSFSCWLWDLSPRPPSYPVVAFTPRLAHHLNHSATED